MSKKYRGFTPYQREAIDFRKGNCLVSAGAGSGKTAVLTERIYWLLVPPLDPEFDRKYKEEHDGVAWSPDHEEDPIFQDAPALCDPSELLVLTFTKAAAFEMKERARNKLAAHKKTAGLVAKIETADITNFDSYNLKMVNQYHHELGLPNKITVLDESFVKVLTLKWIEETLAPYYDSFLAEEGGPFGDLLDDFCAKDDFALIDAVNKVLSLASLSGDPSRFFENYENEYMSPLFYDKTLTEACAIVRNGLRKAYDMAGKYDDPDIAENDRKYLSIFISAPTLAAMHEALLTNPSWPAASKKNTLSDFYRKYRDKVKKYANKFLDYAKVDPAFYLQEEAGAKAKILLLVEIARKVYEKKLAYMREHSSYDFEGVAKLLQDLLQKESFRESFKKRYRFIMVDEYQDTSNLQENFLNYIVDDNLFCVGDIKQSIYRFRKANPKVFASKLKAYSANKGGHLITLPDNFRSREQVLRDINALFEEIMVEGVGGVDYKNGHALKFGNHSFDATSDNENYGLEVVHYDVKPSEPSAYTEARWVAEDIADKVARGYKIKKGPCDYGDFAILVSRKKDFHHYVRAFKDVGVPLFVEDTYKVDNDDVVAVYRSLFRLLSSLIYRNVDSVMEESAYVGLARSFLFDLPDDEIYRIHSLGDNAAYPFYPSLLKVAKKVKSLTLEETFLELEKEFSLLEKLANLGDIELNFQKIEKLSALASSLEGQGFGIKEFSTYLDELSSYGVNLEIKGGGDKANKVRLMSDHASKGLQFPICYFTELGKKPTTVYKTFICTSEYGVVGSNLVEHGDSLLATLAAHAEIKENLSERMRLFYVGLTRAEEKMILLLSNFKKDKDGNEVNDTPLDSGFANSFRGFFLSSGLSFPEVDASSNNGKLPAPAQKVDREVPPSFSLEIRQVDCKGREIALERASKEAKEPIDPAILAKGNRLHRIMEFTSFRDKTLPPLKEGKEKEMFQRLLELPLFKDAQKAKEYHEYEFFDEEKELNGIIDMFLLYEDHIDLIDFKTSTLDENAYSHQLGAYAEYLSKVFPGRRIDKYLLSITQGRLKRVD